MVQLAQEQMFVEAADQPAQSHVHETLLVPPAIFLVRVRHSQAREPCASQDILQLHADLKIK